MVEVWLFSHCDFSVSEAQRCSSVEPLSGPSLCLVVWPGEKFTIQRSVLREGMNNGKNLLIMEIFHTRGV